MLSNALARFSTSRVLRRIVLPMFERFNPGDVRIRHHYTRQRLLLHSYRHKGYWFHGRRREQSTMRFFQHGLVEGDTVLEVGGHIGYMSMFFAQLVGMTGCVRVFEPGRNNLPYLRANVGGLPNVQIVEAAVSDTNGTASFFEEGLTGQNNSLHKDYERFAKNREFAFSNQRYQEREVTIVRLDTYSREHGIRPDLIKIDIEGAEFMALTGATELLAEHRPMLMVEVTRHVSQVFELLMKFGYEVFTPEGNAVQDAAQLNDNICALHPAKHRDRFLNWIGSPRQVAA